MYFRDQVYNAAGQALLLVGGAEGRWWLREDGVWQQAADSQESWRCGPPYWGCGLTLEVAGPVQQAVTTGRVGGW